MPSLDEADLSSRGCSEPAFLRYSKVHLKFLLVLIYSSLLLGFLAGQINTVPLTAPEAQNSTASLKSVLYSWDVDVDVNNDRFIGLSLSADFAEAIAESQGLTFNRKKHKFSAPASLHLTIAYWGTFECTLASTTLPASVRPPFAPALKLPSDRLALLGETLLQEASACPMYRVTVYFDPGTWGGDFNSTGLKGLQIEKRTVSWSEYMWSIRLILLIACTGMGLFLSVHMIWTLHSGLQLALGVRSSLFILTGLILMVDPPDLFGCRGSTRWMAPFGITFTFWSILQFPAEVHRDLNKLSNCQGLQRASFLERFLRGDSCWWLQGALLVINLASIFYWSGQVGNVLEKSQRDPVPLATYYSWTHWTIEEAFAYSGFCTPAICFFAWFCCSLVTLRRRLNCFPYSACRKHFQIYSFATLVILLASLTCILLGCFGLAKLNHSGPWSRMDILMALQLLPSPGNGFIPEQLIVCLMTLIMVLALRSKPDRVLQAQSISRSPLAAPLLASEAVSVLAAGIPLSTVRLLCHCSHRTYKTKRGGELTQEHLLAGLPALEADMDYSRLALHKVIRREAPLDLDLVVFIASLPWRTDSEQDCVGIVSFRGTATKKNIQTDLDYDLVPVALPNLQQLFQTASPDVMVHQGFQKALLAVYDEVLAEIKKLDCGSLWLTGHSMGGAMATLLAAELHAADDQYTFKGQSKKFKGLGVCTFGCPRLGNESFAAWFGRSGISSVRVVCERDPAASLPPKWRWWKHWSRKQTYKHVQGLVRVSYLGHLVPEPNFLEETLRKLHHRTNLAQTMLKCFCGRIAKNHKIRGYVQALHAAQALESGARASVARASDFVEMQLQTNSPSNEWNSDDDC